MIGHKADSYIIRGPKLLLPSLILHTNKFNALHGYEPIETPIECNIQPPVDHFKSGTSPEKTSPVISDNMGRLNHNSIDNGDVDICPSEFLFEDSQYIFWVWYSDPLERPWGSGKS